MSVSVSSPDTGGRRSLDAEINLVPMIDLLVCCITFLVLTAVWSTMSRLPADAQAPGQSCAGCSNDGESLHVEMREGRDFHLVWRQGGAVVRTVDVPRQAMVSGEGRSARVAYPALAQAMRAETAGREKMLAATLHTDDTVPFREMAGVMDALLSPKLLVGARELPKVSVSLARD